MANTALKVVAGVAVGVVVGIAMSASAKSEKPAEVPKPDPNEDWPGGEIKPGGIVASGDGPVTAGMPQGGGSYVGDPKGFTTWPGQGTIQNQRRFGEELSVLGYDVGDWKAAGYTVVNAATFAAVKRFQAHWNLYKQHYQGSWAPTLGKLDGLLGPNTISALVGLVVNNVDWQAAIEAIESDVVDPVPSEPSSGGSNKAALYAMLRALPQLTEDQRLFIMLVAYGETGGTFRASAHNDTDSEVAASLKAWSNNPTLTAKLEANGIDRDQWAIGSGGYGGRLVPYFGDDMLDAKLYDAVRPQLVFDPVYSLLSSLIVAWKLQQGSKWKNSDRTVKNLRAGYYGLAYIANPPADRIAKYRKHAEAVGLSPNFVDTVLPTFPSPAKAKAMLAILRA